MYYTAQKKEFWPPPWRYLKNNHSPLMLLSLAKILNTYVNKIFCFFLNLVYLQKCPKKMLFCSNPFQNNSSLTQLSVQKVRVYHDMSEDIDKKSQVVCMCTV